MLLSEKEIADYKRDGFLFRRKMYSSEEMDLFRSIAKSDRRCRFGREQNGRAKEFGKGQLNPLGELRKAEIYHFRDPEDLKTIYNALVFGNRMQTAMRQLCLDPEEPRHAAPDDKITLHHRKFVMKDQESYLPSEQDATGQHSGNRWQWHQDYTYWYEENRHGGPGPFPDMVICSVAIDPATRENGCLQLLRGSHKAGRQDSVREEWGERHIEESRVRMLQESGCDTVHCEMEPGDVVFFHCNIVHQSFPNATASPRWAMLIAFDSVKNARFYKGDLAQAPPQVFGDSKLLEFGTAHRQALLENPWEQDGEDDVPAKPKTGTSAAIVALLDQGIIDADEEKALQRLARL